MEDQYANSIVDTILDFLKDKYKESEFHAFFYGDPIVFGKSMLPAIVVSETTADYELGPTGFDDISHQIQIKVIFNKSDEYGKPANEAGLARKIHNIVQGRDKITGDFTSNSLMGLLRTQFTLSGLTYNHVDSVQFNTVSRPNDQITEEALITITMNILNQVPSRT